MKRTWEKDGWVQSKDNDLSLANNVCGCADKIKLPKDKWPTVDEVYKMSSIDQTGWSLVDEWWFKNNEEWYEKWKRNNKSRKI